MRNRRSASQAFDSGSQRQIVSLNALSKDFAGQMLILRHLSGVTPPVIAGYYADIKRCEQSQQRTAGCIGPWPKSIGQHTACFRVVRVPEPVLPGFAADLHCSSSSQMSATSA